MLASYLHDKSGMYRGTKRRNDKNPFTKFSVLGFLFRLTDEKRTRDRLELRLFRSLYGSVIVVRYNIVDTATTEFPKRLIVRLRTSQITV